jgi:hypothetical protein
LCVGFVGTTGDNTDRQSVGGGDGSVEGGAVGFCVVPVPYPSGPLGGAFVVVLGFGGQAKCDVAFSALDGDDAIGWFLLFDLARRRG